MMPYSCSWTHKLHSHCEYLAFYVDRYLELVLFRSLLKAVTYLIMAEDFKGLLGENLISVNGAEVNILDLVGEGKTVGLYFSAHWCPPCRGFTPKLAEFYKKHHLDKNFEIVFVSSDKSEGEFKVYHKEMPWLALPFSERSRKDKLSKKFKVSGIPTLVLLDGKDGKVITENGRANVLDDTEGINFPWRPKGLRELLQAQLFNNKNEEKSFEDLDGKVLGLYFTAHWCPPCRSFTPKLIETYNKLVGSKKPFEIVFVSSDRTEGSYNDYFKSMPWLALPFQDGRVKSLSQRFGVQGIPTLILLDENLKVISTNGRALISGDPDGKEFPWLPKPLSVLDELTVNAVNDEPCLIYFTDGEETSIKKAQEILQPVAESFFEKKDPPVRFFYTKNDDLANSLRDFIDFQDDDDYDDDNTFAILDIPSQKLFVPDANVFTREAVTNFVKDYEDGKLEARILKG